MYDYGFCKRQQSQTQVVLTNVPLIKLETNG